MRFTKLHGLGNDYVYVDCFAQSPPGEPGALSRRISDRHRGVGSDGLILILPSEIADARMRIFNTDGSEGEMCGNGIRCVAKYLYDRGLVRRTRMTVQTGRGILTLDATVEQGRVSRVRVDMGVPALDAAGVPTTLGGERVIDCVPPDWPEGRGLAARIAPAGATLELTCVSTGNPHAVIYCRDVSAVPLAEVGPVLENAPFFPQRANVHFAQVLSSSNVSVRTWERGSGITQACGTGASAVCVAGVLTERSSRSIVAHLPGGDLYLEWSVADDHVYMTGPATEVFTGEWPD